MQRQNTYNRINTMHRTTHHICITNLSRCTLRSTKTHFGIVPPASRLRRHACSLLATLLVTLLAALLAALVASRSSLRESGKAPLLHTSAALPSLCTLHVNAGGISAGHWGLVWHCECQKVLVVEACTHTIPLFSASQSDTQFG